MPHEMAPYQIASLALIAFLAVAIQANIKWKGSAFLPRALGILLAVSSFHMAFSPVSLSDGAWTENVTVVVHVVIRFIFAVLVTAAALHALRQRMTSGPS